MGCNCTKTPPPEQTQWIIGTWSGNQGGQTVTLTVSSNGEYAYSKTTPGTSVKSNGPINSWTENGFSSKPCCCCNRDVTFEDGGESEGEGGRTIVVDGVTLRKTSPDGIRMEA